MRWATVDPNPMAQKREARKIEEQAAEAVRRALPEEFVREIEGRDPEARKRKRVEGGFGLQGYEAPDEVWYARSRAVQGGEMAEVEGGEERYLVEDGPVDEPAVHVEEGGILSSSTLAALRDYSARNNGKTLVSSQGPRAPAGPLVAYGSDDESD